LTGRKDEELENKESLERVNPFPGQQQRQQQGRRGGSCPAPPAQCRAGAEAPPQPAPELCLTLLQRDKAEWSEQAPGPGAALFGWPCFGTCIAQSDCI